MQKKSHENWVASNVAICQQAPPPPVLDNVACEPSAPLPPTMETTTTENKLNPDYETDK